MSLLSRRHRVGTRALVGAVLVTLAACGTSGRDLRPPVEGAVSPTRSTTAAEGPTTTGGVVVGAPMALTSPDVADGGVIPTALACGGPSPALSWTGVPTSAQDLALVMVDADAGGLVHWIVTGIAPTDGSVAQGQTPAGAQPRPNDHGSLGWTGPCPPPGETHTYTFLLLARTQATPLSLDLSPKDLVAALEDEAGANVAVLTATYGAA